jgi:hypothetical protein
MKKLLFLIFCFGCIACTTSGSSQADNNQNNPSKEDAQVSSPVVMNPQHQAFALWISGLSTQDTSAGYLKYQESSNNIWRKVVAGKINPILNFRDSFLAPVKKVRKLFYPFSGGDFLYANVFFPEIDTLIMVGLEPPGSLFIPDSLPTPERQSYLSKLSQSLFFSNELGFFRTLSMEKELKQIRLNGTLHPIVFYLARSGYQINRILPSKLLSDGSLAVSADTSRTQSNIIYYQKAGETKERVLYYFSIDLSDSGLKQTPAFTQFLKNQGEFGVFLKAASYLLHQAPFSTIRSHILEQSSVLLQDDSGVPLKFLKNQFDDIQVFGEYTQTIPLFASFYQPELKSLFADSAKVRKTGFIIGYNQQFRQTNLIFAKKMRTL